MKLLQIGCGKMGKAMLDRWAQTTDHAFTVVDPAAQDLPPNVQHLSLQALGNAQFDAIIVGIKPQMIDSVLGDYKANLAAGGWVFSMAAGASWTRFEPCLGTKAVVRIMPNLPALIGQSMSGLFASDDVTAAQRDTAQALAAAIGPYLWVDAEDTLDRVTAVAGSGPGYVFEIMRSYVDAAVALGFDREQARTLVLQTILGSAQMAMQSDLSLEEMRNSVTSKNGTTQAGLEKLRSGERLAQLLDDCTQAAYARAVQLR